MRPLVSYDDISLPYTPEIHSKPTTAQPSEQTQRPPPSKKRKRRHNRQNHSAQKQKHWDDPEINSTSKEEIEGSEDDEESRELTHEEIWNDSALIEAWDAATEEYEAYHGTNQDWKKEVVHDSALWYNVPPSPAKFKVAKDSATELNETSLMSGAPQDNTEPLDTNSRPLNFETFVPTHDPSLHAPLHPPPRVSLNGVNVTKIPGATLADMDEAFERAMGAMYWSGYWTAMYHSHKAKLTNGSRNDDEDLDAYEVEEEIAGTTDSEDFVTAQR